MEAICLAVRQGKRAEVVRLVDEALKEGATASEILNNGLIAGLRIVGDLFSKNEIFVPEMLIAARAMQAALDKLKPMLEAAGEKPRGVVVAGTVKGDLHDIGKNLVCIMVRGAGYQVIDAGVDCSAEKFIQLAKEHNCQAILCSALLTTTMPYMKTVVDQVRAANLPIKVIIGGAPVTKGYSDKIGADGYGSDANDAVLVTDTLLAVAS
jgi:5-methyltetrahydrofolate--homocysteine methyltransferase